MDSRLEDGIKLQLNGQTSQAKDLYHQILKDDPKDANAHHLLGVILSAEEGRYPLTSQWSAIEHISTAICIKPDGTIFHHNIAGIYGLLGRFDLAIEHYREAIKLDPTRGDSFQGLTEVAHILEDSPIIRIAREQLIDAKDPAMKSCFHFALGAIYDGLEDYDRAFNHFVGGNKWADRKFSSLAFEQRVKDTIYIYDPGHPTKEIIGNARIPIFIVGMPRSGTTLVEQILASHPKVYGAGELHDMEAVVQRAAALSTTPGPFPLCMPGLGPNALDTLALDYSKRTSWYNDQISHVVDKHPLNFQYIGLILDLFPYAKIIHVKRDPMDMILSCFFQHFTRGMDFSFDLLQLAHFYINYKRLMQHWESLYSRQIYTVNYEELVNYSGNISHAMIDFCELNWEEQCMQPHKTERVIRTASYAQVRKPIYKNAIGRWKNYKKWMKDVEAIVA
jgi:tetratricopeptide (TPR) repeat protein|tara:strand:+ start:4963 stop:6306 length:1344 start_codon:yes stop_codon:yes gene_type:complete